MADTIPAITVWQPWATLIALKLKPWEFRRWAAPKRFVGKRLAIHAGARPMRKDELKELLLTLRMDGQMGTGLEVEPSIELLERCLAGLALPRSHIVCTVRLGTPLLAKALPAKYVDSNRIDHQMFAWPMEEVRALEPPAPATGAQGFWNWKGAETHG